MQGRNCSAVTLAPNTVRWVNGPNGTIVTFSGDIGLPDIFSPVPCRYSICFLLTTLFFSSFNLTILVISTSYMAFWFGGLCSLATLPLVKNVLVRIVRMHTSIGIPSRSFPCAVSIATGHYMERRSL